MFISFFCSLSPFFFSSSLASHSLLLFSSFSPSYFLSFHTPFFTYFLFHRFSLLLRLFLISPFLKLLFKKKILLFFISFLPSLWLSRQSLFLFLSLFSLFKLLILSSIVLLFLLFLFISPLCFVWLLFLFISPYLLLPFLLIFLFLCFFSFLSHSFFSNSLLSNLFLPPLLFPSFFFFPIYLPSYNRHFLCHFLLPFHFLFMESNVFVLRKEICIFIIPFTERKWLANSNCWHPQFSSSYLSETVPSRPSSLPAHRFVCLSTSFSVYVDAWTDDLQTD